LVQDALAYYSRISYGRLGVIWLNVRVVHGNFLPRDGQGKFASNHVFRPCVIGTEFVLFVQLWRLSDLVVGLLSSVDNDIAAR